MLDELIEEAERRFDLADRGAPLVDHLLDMITDRDHGRIQGFLAAFREEGMEAEVDSWVAPGEGEALSGPQVEIGLGPGLVAEIGQEIGLDAQRAATALGFLIPRILGALTPEGTVPDDEALLARVAALREGAEAKVPEVIPTAPPIETPVPRPAPPAPTPPVATAVEASEMAPRRFGVGRWLLPLIVLLAVGWWAAKQCAPESPTVGDPPSAPAQSDPASAPPVAPTPEPGRDVTAETEPDTATPVTPIDSSDPNPDSAAPEVDGEEGVASVADLAPDFTTEQLVATLNRGSFDFAPSSAAISAGGRALLEEAAQAILALPSNTRLEIAGHTDSSGEPQRNQRLSQARAEAVRNVLVEYGVPSIMLAPRGYGSTRPLADNDTIEGRERNRRIEFTVLEAEGE